VVSPRPRVIFGERGPGKALVAHSGRVRVKVDARHGAIRAGDLLVTSPMPGPSLPGRGWAFNGTFGDRAKALNAEKCMAIRLLICLGQLATMIDGRRQAPAGTSTAVEVINDIGAVLPGPTSPSIWEQVDTP